MGRRRKREKKRVNNGEVIMVIKTSKCQQLMGHGCRNWTRKMRKKKLKIKTYGQSDSKLNVKNLKPTSLRHLCRQKKTARKCSVRRTQAHVSFALATHVTPEPIRRREKNHVIIITHAIRKNRPKTKRKKSNNNSQHITGKKTTFQRKKKTLRRKNP